MTRSNFVATACLLFSLSGALRAGIVDVRGSVGVAIEEIAGGATVERNEVDEFLPQTSATLPIRAFGRVFSVQPSTPGAAVGAAQISDIGAAIEPNPQDFSLNLAMNSLDKDVFFRGRARAEEIRVVRFSRDELQLPAGVDTRVVESRLFLDGVLALFSAVPDRDLSGARVALNVTIDRRPAMDSSASSFERLLAGRIELLGTVSGQATSNISGAIPADRVISTSLMTSENGLGSFPAIIIPELVIPYTYVARVDEEFELVASISVEAECRSPDVGAVALIGTPVDDLRDIIDEVNVPPLTAGVVATVDSARESTRTDDAGLDAPPNPAMIACGGLGLEAALMLMLMGVVGTRRRSRAA
ncbi:MAG: hypothetical protein JNG88_01015 [Phycisphaerales bacterium]|nr:hypothetical protein [Phycisphaerales bacterium]